MLPFSQALEHMVCRILPDAKAPEREKELDERLLASPALALGRCKQVLDFMAPGRERNLHLYTQPPDEGTAAEVDYR